MRWTNNGGEGAVKNKAVVVEYLQFDDTMTNMAIKDKKTARIAEKPLPPPPRRPWGGCGVSALGWFESIMAVGYCSVSPSSRLEFGVFIVFFFFFKRGIWARNLRRSKLWFLHNVKKKEGCYDKKFPPWMTQTLKCPWKMLSSNFFYNTNVRLLQEEVKGYILFIINIFFFLISRLYSRNEYFEVLGIT